MPTCGDASVYAAFAQRSAFSGISYQPLYPALVWSVGRTGLGLGALHALQIAMFAASAVVLLLVVGRAISPVAGIVAAGLLLLDLHFQFYVANPLTETTNLFLSVALLFVVDRRLAPGSRAAAWLVATAALLLALAAVRTSNVFFASIVGFAWAVLAWTSAGRGRGFPWAGAAVAVALAVVLQQAAAAAGHTSGGVVLGQFLSVACRRAPEACAADPGIPARPAEEANWSAESFRRMREAWRRLLVGHPSLFARAVANTWREQVDASPGPAYPEDPNRAHIADRPRWSALLAAGGALASLACAAAPLALLLVPSAVLRAWADPRRQALLVALGAWVFGEIVATTCFFANAFWSDASRMRLHWELQAMLLWVVLADGWLRPVSRAPRS